MIFSVKYHWKVREDIRPECQGWWQGLARSSRAFEHRNLAVAGAEQVQAPGSWCWRRKLFLFWAQMCWRGVSNGETQNGAGVMGSICSSWRDLWLVGDTAFEALGVDNVQIPRLPEGRWLDTSIASHLCNTTWTFMPCLRWSKIDSEPCCHFTALCGYLECPFSMRVSESVRDHTKKALAHDLLAVVQ